jgi:hypothetical protein
MHITIMHPGKYIDIFEFSGFVLKFDNANLGYLYVGEFFSIVIVIFLSIIE